MTIALMPSMMANTAMVSSSMLLASSSLEQNTALVTTSTPASTDTYVRPSLPQRALGIATLAATNVFLWSQNAFAQPASAQPEAQPAAPVTPSYDEIYGDQANNGLGDTPITELPNAPDHTLAWAMTASFISPLARGLLALPLRLLAKTPIIKRWMPTTSAQESLAVEGWLNSANHFVGRAAESRVGSIAAHLRNIAAVAVAADSFILDTNPLKLDLLRHWSDNPESLLLLGVTISWATRGFSYLKARRLKKAGVPEDQIRTMRQHALGFLPKSLPSPKQMNDAGSS